MNFQTAEEYKGYTALGIFFVNFLNVAVNINKHKFNTHLCTNDWLVNGVFLTIITKFFDNYLCVLGRSISIVCTQFIMLYYNRTYLLKYLVAK